MDRRSLLRGIGAATALTLLPDDVRAAWARAASSVRPAGGLTDAQLALVSTLADVILPRTDIPGALDVRVPAFVDAVVSESWTEADRAAFGTGLDALRARFGRATGSHLTELIDAIEQAPDRGAEPVRTYWRLKSLIVHGYFTSERVATQVLNVQIMPGKFDGAAPMPLKRAPRTGAGGAAHA